MKRILQERKIIEILKEYNSKYGVLLEGSKLKILTDKVGFSEPIAKIFDELCGPLAVWMANKFYKLYVQRTKNFNVEGNMTPQEIKEFTLSEINKVHTPSLIRIILPIMDYIRVGLNGNKSSLEDDKWSEIFEKQKQWHDSLGVGEGKINYVENNPILIDFRNEDGEGYYWVDLQTKNSPEECERMGHCGRSSKGYLYSLRSNKKLPGGKFKINKSHVTASIGNDGILYQMKGPKNEKPKEEFHQYIEPLFFALGGGGEEDDYLIRGFGTEYAAQQDFKLTDLPDQTIRDLYNNRPELFNTRSLQRKLSEMGIVDVPPLKTTFTLELDSNNINLYLKGNKYKTTKIKLPNGQETIKRVGIFERVLNGETYDIWQGGYYNLNELLKWYVDDENKNKIEKYIDKKISQLGKQNEIDDNLPLAEKINRYDDGTLKNKIIDVFDNITAGDYGDFLLNSIETALNKYGNVYEWGNNSIKVQIDLRDLGFEDSDLDEYYENCGGEPDCVFNELISEDQIDIPKVDTDFDYDLDKEYYNEELSGELDELVNESINQKKIVNILKEYNQKFGNCSSLINESKMDYWQEKINEALEMLKKNEGEYNQNVVDNSEYINNIKIVKSETKKDKYLKRPLKLFYVKVDTDINIDESDLADIYSEIIYILKQDSSFDLGFSIKTQE